MFSFRAGALIELSGDTEMAFKYTMRPMTSTSCRRCTEKIMALPQQGHEPGLYTSGVSTARTYVMNQSRKNFESTSSVVSS